MNIKMRLTEGAVVHGCWLNLGSSVTAEIVGLSGFDWVLIDLEHGAGSEEDVLYQLQAVKSTPAAAIVRVESSERQRIHRVLDLGAEGVMFPRVRNVAEASKAMQGLRYPPKGVRGVARMVRATRFGDDFDAYYNSSQDTLLGIVQVETTEILDQLDEVAALDGVDVLFIGPSDLTMALGVFGQFNHSQFNDAVERTVAAAIRNEKAAGILLPDPDEYGRYREMGIRFFACGADATFVADGARRTIATLNRHRDAYEKGR